jgi:hypothetical protein
LVYDATELLRFSAEESIPGYYPERPSESGFECVALTTDGSFRILDRKGNEIALDPSGIFSGMAIASDFRMIKRITVGDQSLEFHYTVGPLGNCLISSAELRNADSDQVFLISYEFDKRGNLCRVRRPYNSLACAGAVPDTRR